VWPFRRSNPAVDGSAALGRRGERLARQALRRAGLKILSSNYRCPAGEVDLIALHPRRDGDVLVFVEVKTRASDFHTPPASAVDAQKQHRLRRCADYYVAGRPAAAELPLRFDVISIVAAGGRPPRVEHIEDAFR
jgi:putative endonuclease